MLGDVYQLNVVQKLNGREISNVFYYLETLVTILTPAVVAVELCGEFFTAIYVPNWKPHFTVRGELTAIWCNRIFPTAGTPQAVPFVSEPGDVLGDSCPNNAAALISFITAVASANYRRRTYFSGIPESRQVGAEITGGMSVAMRDLGEAMRDRVLNPPSDAAAEYTFAAFSKKLAAASDPSPVEIITGVGVTVQIRSQRGRNLFTWTKGV